MFKLYKIKDGQRKEIKQTTKQDLSYKLNKKPIKVGNSLLGNKESAKIFLIDGDLRKLIKENAKFILA